MLLTHAAAMLSLILAAQNERPQPDPEAIRDAVGRHGVHEDYASSRAYLHYLESRMADHGGNLGKAVEELKKALVYDDGSAELHTQMGWLNARLNDLNRAEAEARTALRLDARHGEAQLLLGKVLLAQHKVEEAKEALERAIELTPGEVEPYLALVRAEAEGNDLPRAEAVAERLATVRPGEGEAYRILAAAAAEHDQPAAAEKYLRLACDKDPWDFASAERLAALLAARADLDGAARLYEKVLHKNPDDADALLGAARVSLQRGEVEAARAYFKKLLATESDDGELRLRAALTYLAARRHDEAMLLLDEAGKADPGDLRVTYYRGVVLEAERHHADAAKAYGSIPASSRDLYALSQARAASCLSLCGSGSQSLDAIRRAMAAVIGGEAGEASDEVLAVVPDVFRRAGRSAEGRKLLEQARAKADGVELRLSLARSLEDEGRAADAAEALSAALKESPEDDRMILALAGAEEKAGRWQQSVDRVRALLRRQPESAPAMNFVGYTWADHGVHLDEARALIVHALKVRPDEGYYLDSLGWCELRQGNVHGAIEVLEKADDRSPGEPMILHHLAQAYVKANRTADAIAAWTRALALLDHDPDPDVRPQVEAGLSRAKGGSASR